MRIKIGDRFRDYTGVPYVVKKYQHSNITFEVDNGNLNDEIYTKKEFMSELDSNRFHVENRETLYTEEQVRKVIEQSYSLGSAYRGVYSKKLENEIIQSLKQLKKD